MPALSVATGPGWQDLFWNCAAEFPFAEIGDQRGERSVERDACRNVLLVVWGEFGRSPKINVTGGRDHWPRLGSVLLAGGGLKMGQVIGASSHDGGLPTDRPISPSDVLATLYKHLGIDPNQNALNLQGRPLPLLPDGRVIDELF